MSREGSLPRRAWRGRNRLTSEVRCPRLLPDMRLNLTNRPPWIPFEDHRFRDGDTIRLEPIALTAHTTGGHTRGCTSCRILRYSLHSQDAGYEVRRKTCPRSSG